MKYNPDTFFERTMTRLNPWIDQPSALGGDFKSGMFTDSYGALAQPVSEPPQDVEVIVECTIKELYCGAIKEIFFERLEIHHMPKSAQLFTR